jgi:hypothetical protein
VLGISAVFSAKAAGIEEITFLSAKAAGIEEITMAKIDFIML